MEENFELICSCICRANKSGHPFLQALGLFQSALVLTVELWFLKVKWVHSGVPQSNRLVRDGFELDGSLCNVITGDNAFMKGLSTIATRVI